MRGLSIMSKHKVKNPVDMDDPEWKRHRRRQQGVIGGTPPAQENRASTPRARRVSRDGQRKMTEMARIHGDTARYTAWVAGMNPADYPDLVMQRVEDASHD